MELKAPVVSPGALSSRRHRDSASKEKVDFHPSFPKHREAGNFQIPGGNKRASDVQTIIKRAQSTLKRPLLALR